MDPDNRIHIPINDLKKNYKKNLIDRTSRIGEEGKDKGKIFFQKIFIKGRVKSWFNNINEPRYFVTFVNRLGQITII